MGGRFVVLELWLMVGFWLSNGCIVMGGLQEFLELKEEV